jgi:SAM-dependent methyltransferase
MFLEFGKNNSGELVSIREVASGKTDLACPFCGQPLIAKKGNVVEHHFAHDGESCAPSVLALNESELPTIDRVDPLDSAERAYLEKRNRYAHSKIYSSSGQHEAVQRLEAMGIIECERAGQDALNEVKKNLVRLDPDLIDGNGRPSKKLNEILRALVPVSGVDISNRWASLASSEVVETQLSEPYKKIKRGRLSTVAEIDQHQRFWLDAFYKRQVFAHPEVVDYLQAKLEFACSSTLYVMRFSGIEGHGSLIKIGVTGRDPEVRFGEVLAALKPHGKKVTGEFIQAFPMLGRLEKQIHRLYESSNVRVGSFVEYFDEGVADELIKELSALAQSAPYVPPQASKAKPVQAGTPGRKKTPAQELLAQYPEVVAQLENGSGIREISRATGRSVNTVQKVKRALDMV